MAVHGVGYHQDREGKGWASEPEDVAADEATMREMGVTGIRLTHYQHGQPIHDLADRDGLVRLGRDSPGKPVDVGREPATDRSAS